MDAHGWCQSPLPGDVVDVHCDRHHDRYPRAPWQESRKAQKPSSAFGGNQIVPLKHLISISFQSWLSALFGGFIAAKPVVHLFEPWHKTGGSRGSSCLSLSHSTGDSCQDANGMPQPPCFHSPLPSTFRHEGNSGNRAGFSPQLSGPGPQKRISQKNLWEKDLREGF